MAVSCMLQVGVAQGGCTPSSGQFAGVLKAGVTCSLHGHEVSSSL